MGRKKLALARIESPVTRQAVFTKRKDGLFKKAGELSVLCDTDVGFIMFAPSGHVNTFAAAKRVEDVFLQFVDRPDELRGGPISNGEALSQRLKQAKHEAIMLEKIAIIEELEEKLNRITMRQHEAQDKLRSYEPDVENITTSLEAEATQQFLLGALQRLMESKAKLLGNNAVETENAEEETTPGMQEETTPGMQDETSMTDQYAHANDNWFMSMGENNEAGPSCFPDHLNAGFVDGENIWDNSGFAQQ